MKNIQLRAYKTYEEGLPYYIWNLALLRCRISTALSDDVYFNVITQLKGNANELYERNELQLTYTSNGRLKSILNDVFDHLGLKAKHQLKYDVFLGKMQVINSSLIIDLLDLNPLMLLQL